MPNESSHAMVELVATVVLPTIALIWLTNDAWLGPFWGLIVALTPPVLWNAGSMIRQGRVSALATVALGSVLLTGSIGLLELDPRWFALKEAAVPLAMGIGVIVSAGTRFAVVGVLLDQMLDMNRARGAANIAGNGETLRLAIRNATLAAGVILAASGMVAFALARWTVISPSGTEAFGDELGSYTLMSFPAILIPTVAASAWVLMGTVGAIERATGEEREVFMR